MNLTNDVAYWITERESIRKKHDAGEKKPWTEDPILATYRFCNVRREDDKVTRWIKKNWRDPYAGHKNMVAAMILARMVNWPPTLEEIGFPKVWNPTRIIAAIHHRANRGEKTWSGAYIVTTCGQIMDKAEYVVQTAGLTVGIGAYTPRAGDTLAAFWTRLRGINGLGAGFLAAQVVADMKHCDPNLKLAEDWASWAAPGPGSRRGLNRYYGRDPEIRWPDEETWLEALWAMMQEVAPLLAIDAGSISAQDYQNVMCEFDKYMRTKLGQGRPRSKYSPDDSYEV